MASYRGEVIAEEGGSWTPNDLRFATEAEARDYLVDLARRWSAVTESRVVPCDDAPNSVWRGGRALPID